MQHDRIFNKFKYFDLIYFWCYTLINWALTDDLSSPVKQRIKNYSLINLYQPLYYWILINILKYKCFQLHSRLLQTDTPRSCWGIRRITLSKGGLGPGAPTLSLGFKTARHTGEIKLNPLLFLLSILTLRQSIIYVYSFRILLFQTSSLQLTKSCPLIKIPCPLAGQDGQY